MQILKLYNVKINRQIEKINSNEKLFSKRPTFRVLVDSISFYNAKSSSGEIQNNNILRNNQQQQQEFVENNENIDEEDENEQNYDYYDQEGK